MKIKLLSLMLAASLTGCNEQAANQTEASQEASIATTEASASAEQLKETAVSIQQAVTETIADNDRVLALHTGGGSSDVPAHGRKLIQLSNQAREQLNVHGPYGQCAVAAMAASNYWQTQLDVVNKTDEHNNNMLASAKQLYENAMKACQDSLM